MALFIAIHFAQSPSNQAANHSSALVILNGGPGGGIVASPPPEIFAIAATFQRSVLLFDYRGMGLSGELLCRTLQEAEKKLPLTPMKVTRCITEIGPQTRHYRSVEIAHDLEALRQALGYRTLDLYGGSNGTVVLQTYAALYPTRVRTAVLD